MYLLRTSPDRLPALGALGFDAGDLDDTISTIGDTLPAVAKVVSAATAPHPAAVKPATSGFGGSAAIWLVGGIAGAALLVGLMK
jgi:hypothetical protein